MDSKSERWRYIWNQNGTLKEVRPPGGGDFAFDALFTYDALGRRLSKDAIGITCWLWNGNVPLHEWTPSQRRNEKGEIEEYQKDLRTWLFEEESFVPLALFQDGKAYSIVTDHLGTPVEAYNEQGEEVWYRRLDMNGKVIEERSMLYTSYKDYVKIPFLFQGQYYDEEIKLAYNRFRYYAPELGRYISEDPVRVISGEPNFYAYVPDTNNWIDLFGLSKQSYSQQKGVSKAKHDLKRNGFTVVGEEVTMKVNGTRVRADIVAVDKHGKTHVFEVKHGRGKLTKNQMKTGVYNMSSQSNTTTHLGGGTIQISKGRTGTFTIDTNGAPGRELGGKGSIHDATFHVLKYN